MRTAYGIYRSLQVYLEAYADDIELDQHFKSGVQLGAGLSSLMLSLLPSKVMKVGFEASDSRVYFDRLTRHPRLPNCSGMEEIEKWLWIPYKRPAAGLRVRVNLEFRPSRKESVGLFAIWLCSHSISLSLL
jgi:hypothetical protein